MYPRPVLGDGPVFETLDKKMRVLEASTVAEMAELGERRESA